MRRRAAAACRARRRIARARRAKAHDLTHALARRRCPIKLTNAQQRVMGEIDADLGHGPPMNRLLQGDVGAGKTFVAVYAMLRAVEAGEQAALMAPTQILAEQHALNLRRWLEPLGIRVDLFTGNTKGKKADRLQGGETRSVQRAKTAQRAKPAGSVVVGTHALLYDRYAADKLGLIVIDEQHKFGVLQRLALSRKGQNPDILVMTATPIPRTLGMTLYGDLDVSILDELPPGRQPILTKRKSPDGAGEVLGLPACKQIGEGRQAYVIYPLVEESEKVDAKSVKAEFERLKDRPAGRASSACCTASSTAAEKERVMTAFPRGRNPGAAFHLGDRGRRRCAERDGHADRERGAVRPGAVAPVARAHRARRACLVLRAGGRAEEPGELAAAEDHGGDDRRLSHRRGGFQDSRPGQHFRHGAERPAAAALRQPASTDYDLLELARDDAARLIKEDPTLARWPGLREKMQAGGAVRRCGIRLARDAWQLQLRGARIECATAIDRRYIEMMSDPATLQKTALHGAHQKLGARLVDFGGWNMPVQYTRHRRGAQGRARGGGRFRHLPHGRIFRQRRRRAGVPERPADQRRRASSPSGRGNTR